MKKSKNTLLLIALATLTGTALHAVNHRHGHKNGARGPWTKTTPAQTLMLRNESPSEYMHCLRHYITFLKTRNIALRQGYDIPRHLHMSPPALITPHHLAGGSHIAQLQRTIQKLHEKNYRLAQRNRARRNWPRFARRFCYAIHI